MKFLPSLLVLIVAVIGLLDVSVCAGSSAAKQELPASLNIKDLLADLPLWFEANQGQSVSEVEFLARGPSYGLFLTQKEIALVQNLPAKPNFAANPVAIHRLRFLNANSSPRLIGQEPLPGKSHYLIGQDPTAWRTNASHFARVEYQDLYPGINLVFYGKARQLEFDFVVAPGADPSLIGFQLAGGDSAHVDEGGNLVISSSGSEAVLQRPHIFQEVDGKQKIIQGEFNLNYGIIRFALGAYNPKWPLVIDPVLSFSTYVGVQVAGIAVDDSGKVYMAGTAGRADLPTTAGAFQPSKPAGTWDIFAMKLDPKTSQVIYATYLGGTGEEVLPGGADIPTGIAVDAQGNAVITGHTFSKDFPLANAAQAQLGGSIDGFVTKINSNGDGLVYSTYLGGRTRFEMDPLSIDFGQVNDATFKDTTVTLRNVGSVPFEICASTGGGAVTFFGTTASCLTGSENEFVNFSARLTVPAHSQSSFTIRFDPLGRGHDKGRISFFNTKGHFIAEIPWKGEGIRTGFPPDPAPPVDETKYRNTPPFFFTSGDGDDFGAAVVVDTQGNAYVVGQTSSANFTVVNSLQPYHGSTDSFSSSDAFAAKFSPEGQMVFSTYIGGSAGENASAVAIDREGNTYIGGSTASGDFPQTAALNTFPPESGNGFVMKLTAGPARAYSTLLGVSNVRGIAIDQAEAAYITGSGGAAEMPTPNAFQKDFGGTREAYVAKLDPSGSSLAYFTRLGGSGEDEGIAIAVDAAGSVVVAGRTESPNFPLKDPVQAIYGGGEFDFFAKGDAFITQLNLDGSALLFSTYLGGARGDAGVDVAFSTGGDIVVGGITAGEFPLTNALPGWSAFTGGFVAVFAQGAQIQSGQVRQIIELTGQFSNNKDSIKVEFVRDDNGSPIRVPSEVVETAPERIKVRVPVGLIGTKESFFARHARGNQELVTIEITVTTPGSSPVLQQVPFNFIHPEVLIYDQIDPPGTVPQHVLPLVNHAGEPPELNTFIFIGLREDGLVGFRALNASIDTPRPLLKAEIFTVPATPPPVDTPLPHFTIFNLAEGDAGIQANLSLNGSPTDLFVVTVEQTANFTTLGQFHVHLAGNVGLPRKLMNGAPEFARGTRLDTLFNHSAPRPQGLTGVGAAMTALFKFANIASISTFPKAVLIPLGGGFPEGFRIVRAIDPLTPLEITTPTARTPAVTAPVVGTVIDFTQLPDPASVTDPAPMLAESVAAVIGKNDGNGVTLPKTLISNIVLTGLILDMGSGHEIVDGAGPDLEVLATSGSYTVQLGNTPYVSSFKLVPGTFSGVQSIDLATAGLKSARYVWIIASPTVVLDTVRALNVYTDEVSPSIGPVAHFPSATITARRVKASGNMLDPFIQLIAPSGELVSESEAGFGDDLSLDLSDAALTSTLSQSGFYRYLVKGYDKLPDNQSAGDFFTRLETSGQYDQVEIAVSAASEDQTLPQKSGSIAAIRQRDSYLFQAAPGATISIVVNTKDTAGDFDPVLELYDPEDFLIGANDNGASRGKSAVLTVTLPSTRIDGATLPNPSTFRIAVSAIDGFGQPSAFALGTAHIRQAASGPYDVKIFSGALAGAPAKPRIDSVNPISGAIGTSVIIKGANFGATVGQNSVRFGDREAPITSATATEIVATVPTGIVSGPVSIRVNVAGQTSEPVNFTVSEPSLPLPTITGAQVSAFAAIPKPGGIAVDAGGNLFVLGRDSGTLSKITPSGSVSVLAELGANPGAWYGPAVDLSGNIYISHFAANEVLKLTPSGVRSTLASFSQPAGLTVDTLGNLYVASVNAGKVFKIAISSDAIVAGRQIALAANPPLTEYATGFSQPKSLSFNSNGELFVANSGNNQISKVPGGGGAAVMFVQLQQTPETLAFDRSGNLLVGTTDGSLLQVTPGGTVSELGRGFGFPTGLAVDSENSIYVADLDRSAIFKAGGRSRPETPSTRQAQARLHSLSLRFHPATGTVFGEEFTLELSSLSLDQPANGELFPAFGANDQEYFSSFLLKGESFSDPLGGDIFITLPRTGDKNGNGLDDFFEVVSAVPATPTTGDYQTDFDEGTVRATWSRAAGSKTGLCQLELSGDQSGLEALFTNTFELLEYSGSLNYTLSTGVVNATVQLQQFPTRGDLLQGPVQFSGGPGTGTNRLALSEGSWTNTAGKRLLFFDAGIQRQAAAPSTYSGSFTFQDGDASTADDDYLDWILVITDPNDTDNDGAPDLVDPPSNPPAQLRFTTVRLENNEINLTWEGTGQLQAANALDGSWLDLQDTTSPAQIPTPANRGFFRLIKR